MNQSPYGPDSFLRPDETEEKFKTLRTKILSSLDSTVNDLKTMGFGFANLATNEVEDELLSGKFYNLLKKVASSNGLIV